MDQYKVGRFIARLRKEHNLTQRALAEQLRITNQAVSKWERGENLPDLALLMELGRIFDVTVDEILNGERKAEAENLKTAGSSSGYEQIDIRPKAGSDRIILIALAIALYVVSPLSFFDFNNNIFLKFAAFIVIISLGVLIQMFSSPDSKKSNRKLIEDGSLSSIIYGFATLIYFLLGYFRGWWHPGWLIFVVASIVIQLIALYNKHRS